MSEAFAAGRIARGICDRCGWEYALRELRDEVVDQKKTGLFVCGTCFDIDHPQLRLGDTPIYDPQALRNPRPDTRSDVTNTPVMSGTYTASGAPIFNTNVTPAVGTAVLTGVKGTIKRG